LSRNVLLFDLDGTLTDPRLGITRCIRYALDQLRVVCPPDDMLASCIGPPLRRSFASLLGTAEASYIEEAMRLYRQRYSTEGLFENEVYEGVPEALRAVRQTAAALFVVTSKPTVYATKIVEHFGLTSFFRDVYGSELDGRFDDKADLLRHLLAMEQVVPHSAVMIGDRAVDVLAAKSNGVGCIGVGWGYGSKDELVTAGADSLCEHPSGLLAALSKLATQLSHAPELAQPSSSDPGRVVAPAR